MSHRHNLKLLRRARKQVKRQLRQLAEFKVTGLLAVTLHTYGQQLTIPLACPTGSPFTDELRELLLARRRYLHEETQQLLLDWQTSGRPVPPTDSPTD
jgi:hypothetical protein